MQLGRRAARSRAGLTLLELMFALTVMAVGVLAAYSGQVGSVDLLRATREEDAAMVQLRAGMELVLAEPTNNIITAFANGSQLAVDGWDFNPMNLDGFELRVQYPGLGGGAVPDPLPIVLTATWNDFRGRPRSQTLSTMVSR